MQVTFSPFDSSLFCKYFVALKHFPAQYDTEAKGTLPETVISEQSRLIIAMNIEKYVQVIWVSPSSGLSLAI